MSQMNEKTSQKLSEHKTPPVVIDRESKCVMTYMKAKEILGVSSCVIMQCFFSLTCIACVACMCIACILYSAKIRQEGEERENIYGLRERKIKSLQSIKDRKKKAHMRVNSPGFSLVKGKLKEHETPDLRVK